MKNIRGSRIAGLALALVAVAFDRSAHAAGFATARFGGEHGNVTETNPFALYYNPGALGFSHAPLSSFLDVQLALRQATYTHEAPAAPPQEPDQQFGNSGKATLFNAFGAPAIAVSSRFDNLAFGIGFFVPFGGFAHWDQTQGLDPATLAKYPRAADGVARWHIISGEVSSIYFTAGVAYRLGPLSVGVGGNLVLSTVRLSQSKTATTSMLPDSINEGHIDLDVQGWNGSFGAGAMLEVLRDRVWLGVSYQSQPGLGPQTLSGKLDVMSRVVTDPTLHENVNFLQALPDIYRAGMRWRVSDAVELRLFGDFTRWSLMQSQCLGLRTKAPDGSLVDHPCQVFMNGADATGGFVSTYIPRNWQDTYGARLGASYYLNQGVEFFGGLGYETGAVPDSTLEPSLMDANNVGAALGTRVMFEDRFYFAVSYTHLQYFDRDNTGQSLLQTVKGTTVSPPAVQQDAGGKYSQWIGVIDVNIQKDF